MVKIRTSHDQNMNITWSKNEQDMIKIRTSHDQKTNITWSKYEHHMIFQFHPLKPNAKSVCLPPLACICYIIHQHGVLFLQKLVLFFVYFLSIYI